MENKKHTQKVIAEPEVVQDGEFMLEPVPENKRRSTRSQIMVWIGFGYAVTGLIVGGTLGGSREELMGYALSSKLRENGKTVEVPLASGCLIVHARVVDTKLAACALYERLAQLVQLRAVIRNDCSSHLALVGHGK